MNNQIARWYREQGINISGEVLDDRKTGINNFFECDMDNNTYIELTKLFFGQDNGREFIEMFTNIFSEIDNTFASDMEEEMKLLAGAIIYKCIQDEEPDIVIALEIYIQSYMFLKCEPAIKEIVDYANNDFSKRALEIRENYGFDCEEITGLKIGKFETDEENTIEYNIDVAKKLNSIYTRLNSLCTTVNKMGKELNKNQVIMHEDTQILWWMMAEYSDDEEKLYKDLEFTRAAILAGKDLASYVDIMPGPFSAKAVLSKILCFTNDKTSIKEYIDNCDDKIINQIIQDGDVNTPLLFALLKKEECGQGNWGKAFSKKYEFKEEEYTANQVAYQLYLEVLLRRFYKES